MLGYLVTVGVFLVIYLAILGLHLLTYGTMCPSALNAARRNARSDEQQMPTLCLLLAVSLITQPYFDDKEFLSANGLQSQFV